MFELVSVHQRRHFHRERVIPFNPSGFLFAHWIETMIAGGLWDTMLKYDIGASCQISTLVLEKEGRHTFFSPSGPIVEMKAIGLGVFPSVRLSSRYRILTMAEIMN
jgi:hypothetical protein